MSVPVLFGIKYSCTCLLKQANKAHQARPETPVARDNQVHVDPSDPVDHPDHPVRLDNADRRVKLAREVREYT